MDLLPVIEQALSDTGITPDDDPAFVGLLHAAAPSITQWVTRVREQIAPAMPRNGAESDTDGQFAVMTTAPVHIEPVEPEPVELDPFAEDLAAGIPVFTRPWQDL